MFKVFRDGEKPQFVLIGVTSRGTGIRGNCGGLDNPTHYVRLKLFLEWIKVKSRACTVSRFRVHNFSRAFFFLQIQFRSSFTWTLENSASPESFPRTRPKTRKRTTQTRRSAPRKKWSQTPKTERRNRDTNHQQFIHIIENEKKKTRA